MSDELSLKNYVDGEENIIKCISLALTDDTNEYVEQVVNADLIDQMHFEYLDKEIHFVDGIYYEWNVAGLIEISFREKANEIHKNFFQKLEDGMRVDYITLHYSNGESVSFMSFTDSNKNSCYQETNVVNGCFVLTIKDGINKKMLS